MAEWAEGRIWDTGLKGKEENKVEGAGSRASQALSKNSGRGFLKRKTGRKEDRRRQSFLGMQGWGVGVRGGGRHLTD